MVTGSRAWWVRTNTGWWNGGSSPHQLAFGFGSSSQGPCPPLNIRRPTTVAPVLRAISASTSLSTPVSPSAPPCRSRNAAVATAQSCSFSPPTPSGSSSDGLGPATNPSSDTDRSNLSSPIMSSSQECAAKATGAASATASTEIHINDLGVCQPRQQAALRPAAANGLGAQSRPVEHRQTDDAVARGAAIAKCRYRRRDSDPLR
jgi:hypothetical protein